MAKNAIGMAIVCEEYGAKFFANGAAPSGALEHPGTLKDPGRVRESWRALLTPEEKKKYFFKFNVDGLMWGDYQSRMQGYATARQNQGFDREESKGMGGGKGVRGFP
jgi:phage portal protein BeeE